MVAVLYKKAVNKKCCEQKMDLVLCKNVFVCKNAFLRTFYFVKCSASHLTMSNLTNAFGAAVFFATSGRTSQNV